MVYAPEDPLVKETDDRRRIKMLEERIRELPYSPSYDEGVTEQERFFLPRKNT